MSDTHHTSVLLREAIDALAIKSGVTVIDATLGSGGHARKIIEKFTAVTASDQGETTLLALDADPVAVSRFIASLELADEANSRVRAVVGNFRNLKEIAEASEIVSADAILADLGWRMEQFGGSPEEGGGKGFSFNLDEPLTMTYGDSAVYPFTARDIVNDWREEDIANVLKAYGEERSARKIASAIVNAREQGVIETSAQLAEIVAEAIPRRGSRIHPATKTFQALRIAVNDELDAVSEFITQAYTVLKPGGRLAIITFHSIEDRIVKRAFRTLADEGHALRITKKPITPTAEEIKDNPRSRSAKLRVIQKI